MVGAVRDGGLGLAETPMQVTLPLVRFDQLRMGGGANNASNRSCCPKGGMPLLGNNCTHCFPDPGNNSPCLHSLRSQPQPHAAPSGSARQISRFVARLPHPSDLRRGQTPAARSAPFPALPRASRVVALSRWPRVGLAFSGLLMFDESREMRSPGKQDPVCHRPGHRRLGPRLGLCVLASENGLPQLLALPDATGRGQGLDSRLTEALVGDAKPPWKSNLRCLHLRALRPP